MGGGRRRRQHRHQGGQPRPLVPATSNPGTAVAGPRRGRPQRRREPGPARHPGRTWSRPSAPTRSATSSWRRPRPPACGVDQVRRDAASTGTYTAVLDADGELVVAVADMAATDELSPADVDAARDLIAGAALLVLDGNLAAGTWAGARPGRGRRRAGGAGPGQRAQGRAARADLLGRPSDPPGHPERRTSWPRSTGLPTGTHEQRLDAAARAARPRRRAGLGPARRGAARCSAGPTASTGLRGRADRGRRRDRRRRRDAGGVLPRRCSAGRRRSTPRPTATPPPRSPSPARTPSAPTSPTDSSESLRHDPSPDAAAHRRGRRRARATAARSSRWRARSSATACPTRSNVAMALEVEGIIREHGAVPATIAVLDGRPAVGLVARRPRAARQPRRRRPRSACATCRTSSPAGRTARRRSRRPCGSRHWPGSGCSSPAASAACTAAPRSPSTSAPT